MLNATLPFPGTTTTYPSTQTTLTKTVQGSIPSTITQTLSVTSTSATITETSHRPTTSVGLVPDSKGSSSSGGGLSTGATIAIAVVVPIIAIILLVLLAIFFWRRKKQQKSAEEARRKEVEEYGYNPNDDPTLPAVAGFATTDSPDMSEDTSGYRGWGNNAAAGGLSARKTSTNLSSGMAMTSDDGRGKSPGSPGQVTDRSGEGMMNGSAGAAVATGLAHRTSNGGANGNNLERGLSNASSTYSAAGRTDESGDVLGSQQEYNYENNYSQYAPYNPGAGGFADGGQPVIRDVNARRNTRIENAVYPQQGNSGIAQNF